MRRAWRVVAVLLAVVVAAGAGSAFWLRAQLRGSLAQLEGERQLSGLSAAVRIERDGLGVPAIRGATREDVARATGFLHAQERFFQMDLARRRAAGELSALVGSRALRVDREIRLHRFRAQADRALELLPARQRTLLDAYTAGVNAGLTALSAPPFEYLALGEEPVPWQPADTFLVVLSMFITLQDSMGEYESTLATMHDVLPPAMYEFLAPRGSEWDTPIDGDAFAVPPVPGPEVYDLRGRRQRVPTPPLPAPDPDRVAANDGGTWDFSPGEREAAAIGSNNFAVAGPLTADGRALLANDMHLAIRVPNTWYRALFEWPDPQDPASPNRLVGVTLPGVPAMVAGSNGQVAWGFTNTYADWSDIVLLEVDPSRPGQYRTPDGWQSFDVYDEVIPVSGAESERYTVRWTIWGPVIGRDHNGRLRAYRWVAHSAEQLAQSITPMESARTIEEAFDEANGLGTPGQNMLVAGRDGRIGWTIYGTIPRRAGLDGQLPASWVDGAIGWNGWLADAEYPRIVNPGGGRLWTANARTVSGPMLEQLGDGSYEIGSRARVIRDRLAAAERFREHDLLQIQLDTSAGFLARWRELAERALTDEAVAAHPARATFRQILTDGWSGEAGADSAAYRLSRMFREEVFARVIAFVLAECYEADPAFDYSNVRRREAAIWRLVSEQPLHLLDPQYSTWGNLLVSAVDSVIDAVDRTGSGDLRDRAWSEMNGGRFRHPLSGGIPFSARWLDMPQVPLPGDLFTPRVHWGTVGASERMVVSPGREEEGIMHMPTGQSGHPLSPFYANSHGAWVRGEPTPLLPGAPVYVLTLVP